MDGLDQRQGALLVCAGGGEQLEGRRIAPALGVRQVLRARVTISYIRVAKLCIGCSSSSHLDAALCCAEAERLADATGSRVALAV